MIDLEMNLQGLTGTSASGVGGVGQRDRGEKAPTVVPVKAPKAFNQTRFSMGMWIEWWSRSATIPQQGKAHGLRELLDLHRVEVGTTGPVKGSSPSRRERVSVPWLIAKSEPMEVEVPTGNVNYSESARRHQEDSELLDQNGRFANAGQLLGFSMECGLKALLIAAGVQPDADGSIPSGHAMRVHMPVLSNKIDSSIAIAGNLIPDTALAANCLALVPGRSKFTNWSIDHRYWGDSLFPIAQLPDWKVAVAEMIRMLDQAILDGVLQ